MLTWTIVPLYDSAFQITELSLNQKNKCLRRLAGWQQLVGFKIYLVLNVILI